MPAKVLITGMPNTGKTTLLKKLTNALEMVNLLVLKCLILMYLNIIR